MLGERVAGLNAKIAAGSPAVQKLFKWGLAAGEKNWDQGIVGSHWLYQKIVFKKVQAMLGGKVKLAFTGSAPLAPHAIQGGGYGMAELTALAATLPPDGYIQVTSDEARETARLLARTEGVFGGFSGGANVAAAAELLRGDHKGGVVACVICDSGLKYLSTDLWPD